MKTIVINDLPESRQLDMQALATIRGGWGFSIIKRVTGGIIGGPGKSCVKIGYSWLRKATRILF